MTQFSPINNGVRLHEMTPPPKLHHTLTNSHTSRVTHWILYKLNLCTPQQYISCAHSSGFKQMITRLIQSDSGYKVDNSQGQISLD